MLHVKKYSERPKIEDIAFLIGDFGIARYLEEEDQAKSMVGTRNYMAPEVLLNQKYDKKADVFSLAVIVYELRGGKMPINPLEPNLEFTDKDSKSFRSLLLAMIPHDPEERCDSAFICIHPFLTQKPKLDSSGLLFFLSIWVFSNQLD